MPNGDVIGGELSIKLERSFDILNFKKSFVVDEKT